MDYREILGKYRDGTASDDERRLAESEIEKFMAIEDFLIEGGEGNASAEKKISEDEAVLSEETKKIRKSVEKRLGKIVFTSVSIVLAILAGIFFAVSPIMDAMYYNPASTSLDPEYGMKNINYDLKVITELNQPEKTFIAASVDKSGFARHNVTYIIQESFSGNYHNINLKIVRGKNLGADLKSDILSLGFASTLFTEVVYGSHRDYAADKMETQNENLKKLDGHNYVSLAASLKNDITTNDLALLKERYPEVHFVWGAVRASEFTDKDAPICIGTSLSLGDMRVGEAVSKKYPALSFTSYLLESEERSFSQSVEVRALGKHYKSMLKYLIDRKEMLGILDNSPTKYEFYKTALEYAEKNGVKLYGLLVYGEVKDLLSFAADENIRSIEVRDVKVSRLGR